MSNYICYDCISLYQAYLWKKLPLSLTSIEFLIAYVQKIHNIKKLGPVLLRPDSCFFLLRLSVFLAHLS